MRLFSDDVAEIENLPSVNDRAARLKMMLDAYGLTKSQRSGFFDLMIEYVVHNTAFQVDEAGITPQSSEQEALWGLAWRARSCTWMLTNRKIIEQAIL